MATQTSKRLGKGQVAATVTAVYTVPAATKAFARYMVLHNTSAIEQTVNIYENGTALTDRIHKIVNIGSGETKEVVFEYPLILAATEFIAAQCDTAAVVNFWVYGMEEA